MRDELDAIGAVNLVFYSLIVNVYVMAIGFSIVSGAASIMGRQFDLLFAVAAGFLGLLGTLLVVFRSFLVTVLDDIVS